MPSMARIWGGDGIGSLVAVVAGEADGSLINADMAVGIDQAGQHITALGVQDFGIRRVQAGADGGDLSAADQHLTVFNGTQGAHGQNMAVFNKQFFHVITRFFLKIP